MFAASTSSAQAGPEVARGLAWLQDQVQPDGSLSGEATSLSHPLQARSETLHTLGQLGAPASSLLPLQTALAADSENNTEFMARRAMVLGLRGLAQPDLIEQLQQSRNVADGGYGGSNGYASHALDTAFVLRAQRASSAFDPAAVSAALAFLASAENTDGAFAANGRSSLYTTAHALLAATAWSDQPGAGAIGVTGQQWLLAQRNAERHFGNASDNALVLWALLGHTSRSEVLQPLVDALRASQLADGSWDHDPYVTAIALRALFLASQPAPPPAAGSLQGMVTSATAVGLANATVQIVGTSIPPTVADGAGRYSFSSVPAGALTVRVSLSGYASRDIAVTLTAGQSLNLGNTVLSPSSLTATVGGVIRSHVGHLVPDAFVAIGTAYGLTDASGAYQLTGLSPGPATVSIKAAGFQSISAPFTLEANVAYVFSPRLTATTGTPPTLTSISGVLIDEASKNALVGASVQLSGSATVLTVVGGAFNFPTVTPGAFSLTLSATGYKAMQVAGVSVAGVNSLGNISLAKLPATTTLSGTITDAATKLAIAGVMVKVDGQGMPVLTGGDGKYLIAGLNGTSFTLMVSASGYLARSEQIKISEVGPGVADLALQAQGSSDSDVSFIKVETFSPSYPASGVIPLEMVLANNAAQSTAVQVSALVLNEQDSVVYEYLASPIIGWQGLNYGNDPVTLAPNSSFAIIIDWNSSRLPAGPYRVKASALDVNGRMVAQAETTFSVTAGAMLGGGVSADPPLAQAGAQTKISLTGDLTNTGNMTLPAGDLSLRILLDRADNSANKVGVVGRSIAAGAPMMSATKLAADAQGNFYTINALDNKLIKIGANGTQTVLATLPAAAWSIDLAIDPDGAIVVAGNNPAKLFKVTQLGAVSTLAVTGLKKILGLDIANDGSYYLSGEYSNGEWGLVRRSPAGVETELARNGFSSPYGMVKDGQGNFIVTNHGNGSLVKVSADGKMAPFVTGLNAPKGITIDAAGNFFVANSGAKTIVKVTPDGRSSVFATGLKDPTDLRFDPTGNLYVSNAGDDSIDRVLPSGVVELFAKGLAYKPKNMRYDAAGNLWLSNEDNTLRKKDAQDKVSVVAAGLSLPRGIAFPGNGDVLVAEAGSGKISRVRGGVVSPFAIGLSYPTGLAIDDAGTLFAAERDANRIARFDSAGNKLGVIESALLEPSAMRANASGEVFIKNTGFVTMLKDGKLRVLHRNFNYSHWTPDTVSGGFIALSGNSVIRLAPDGAVTTVKSGLPFTPAGVTLGESGTIVLLDSANRKLHKLDGGGALTVLSILPFGISAGEMQADNNGKIFLRLLDARFYRVLSDGSLAALTFGASEPVVGWTAGRNGELVVWSASKTYRLDSISNTTSVWFPAIGSAPGASAIHGAAVDSAGNLAAANSGGHVLNVYGGSGTRVAQFHGFTLPRDIVWTGSEMRFVDGADGLFSMTGDSYPVKKPGTLLAQFLAHSGAETLGVSGTGIIYRWTGNGSLGYDTYFTAADSLSGIAAKGDGTLAIGTTTSRVIILDQTRAIVRDFAGLRTPQGLAFDASGRLYVANFDGETVGRFDSLAVPLATTFAKVTNPRALAIDAAGRVTLSAGFTIYRLDASGNASTLSAEGHTFNSLLADGADMYAADFANAQLRKLNISAGIASWDVFATGVAEPVAVRVAADSGVFVLNKGSNTIVKFDAGKIGTVARVPAGMNALALAANGALTAVGNSGVAVRVASDGAVSGLGIELLVNKWDLSGVHDAGNGKLYVLSNNRNAPNFGGLLEVSVTEAPVTPPAGTMVFQASVPMAAMEANGSYARFDFGKWTPPYGGDFKIELWREGIEGKASNFVHVGPHAEALLSAARTMVAPGDSELNMCLDLKGADFTSISRVETGQVRAVSAALSPIGMVGDRQGRLYVTDRTSLYRTNESGESVKIADGMKLARGLAIDAEQNFYVVSEKPGSGNYELIRISPAGVKTVVADLGVKPDSGVETAGGVQVNSKDEVLVGTRGKLLKVDKQGVVTVVTTSGLPSPISIAIDGRDNVYVQNALHIVTKIAADGTSSTIFSKADRVNDPLFENEGMSIAADCADNLYVAAQIWGKFNQSGEEHTLAQVAPRTGNVALVFDTLKIDPTLGDIDDIAFDRFNNRILMWNHGTNRIWQVPVTCGAIGVQAHLVAQPGQTLTGASKPPSATIPRADGRTEYVWSLRDVPAQGAQVCFSATQRNFMLGEERKAIDSGFISFQNSFAAGDITVPLAVPLVRAVNLVNLNVGTDLPVYAPNTNAVVSTTLVNTDTQAVSGTLKVQVFDSAGKLVADIGEQQVSLAGAGAIPVIAPFNTGAIVAGNYSVVAVLVGDNGTVARSQSDFKVVDAGAAAPAHATVASDRTLYQPNERVVLTTRVFNDSS
ncbi:MAG: carboxypeptidase regulatory-like domain-containing protein, partial [Pseudomonadota bacterium]